LILSFLCFKIDNETKARHPKRRSPPRKKSSPIRIPKKLLELNKARTKIFRDLTVAHMELYKKWKLADMVTAFLAVFSIFISLIEYEVGWAYYRE
jgi:hypothetical protein